MRLALAAVLAASTAAAQEAPLSAIDWLSESVSTAPVTGVVTPVVPAAPVDEEPVAGSAAPGGIKTSVLGAPEDGRRGAIAPGALGLPADPWPVDAASEAALAARIRTATAPRLPAMQALLRDLMLAQAPSRPTLDLARVDGLLAMGMVAEARALLEAGPIDDPETMRRWFDAALLLGDEQAACARLAARPMLAPTVMARVFCQARGGDWQAASLTLATARALGDLPADEDALLTAFLDPDHADAIPTAAPAGPTPLVHRLREAVGIVDPTDRLPLAFAHADLRATKAWRARLEAGERLARRGAIEDMALATLYAERRPAASGGIWDRAAAWQAVGAALAEGGDVAVVLDDGWNAAVAAGAALPFARLVAPQLDDLDAGPLGERLKLLAGLPADVTGDPTLAALAAGGDTATIPDDPRDAALVAGLAGAEAPEELRAMLADGRVGEALLAAADLMDAGLDGDAGDLRDGLATLVAAGQPGVARQAAIEVHLLWR